MSTESKTQDKQGGGDQTTTTTTTTGSNAYKAKGRVFKRRKPKKAAVSDKAKNGMTAAKLRVESDRAALDMPNYCSITDYDPDNWQELTVTVKPDRGFWQGATYHFKFKFPPKYPFDAPKVRLREKIYHPNIDLEGKVCVSVLRPWKPTYSVQSIVFGLIFLFTTPNPGDPLNKEAAAVMRQNVKTFEKQVQRSLDGHSINGVSFVRNRNY